MAELTTADWERLEALAGRVGIAPERVATLRRRMDGQRPRPGNPYTLLVGRPDKGLELLLARWISADAADALKQAGERPLVLGPTPGEVRPALGSWPTWKWRDFGMGHLLALRCPGRPGPELLAQLSGLGHLDQLVLVSRLGQPLDQTEREMVRALGASATLLRVLFVGLAGEEPTDSDLAEVSAYAASQMRLAGFSGSRYLGAAIWFTGGQDGRPGVIRDPGLFFTFDEMEVAANRAGMFQQGLADLIGEIRQRCEQSSEAPPPPVPVEEADRLTRELTGYLSDLGRELTRLVNSPRPMSTEALRAYTLDAVRGWGAYTSVEGFWLKYVERLRPGTQAALMEELQGGIDALHYEPPGEVPATPAAKSSPTPAPAPTPSFSPTSLALPTPSPGFIERLTVEAKRIGVGILFGLGAYLVANRLLPRLEIPGLLTDIASWVAFFLGGLLGYAIARKVFAPPRPFLTAFTDAPDVPPAKVHGWEQVQRRLTAWFSERIHNSPPTPAEECRDLAARIGLQEVTV